MNQFGLLDTRVRRNGEHYGRNLINGCNVENQFLVSWELSLTLESHEDNRRSRRKPFIPSGEGIVFCGLDDAGPHDAPNHFGFGGDELFSQSLRISIDVWPTPEFGTLNAQLGQSIANPNFSLARNCQTKRIGIVGITHLFIEPFARLLAK